MIPIYIISLQVISPIICPTYTHFAKERKKEDRERNKETRGKGSIGWKFEL